MRSTSTANVFPPIDWDELDDIYPTDLNIANVPERLAKICALSENILDEKVDLYKKLLQAR